MQEVPEDHYTLLDMEDYLKPKDPKEPSGSMTYMAPSKQDEEVLLMSCSVKVTAPSGSVVQARILLDCPVSTSLITECLAQL